MIQFLFVTRCAKEIFLIDLWGIIDGILKSAVLGVKKHVKWFLYLMKTRTSSDLKFLLVDCIRFSQFLKSRNNLKTENSNKRNR